MDEPKSYSMPIEKFRIEEVENGCEIIRTSERIVYNLLILLNKLAEEEGFEPSRPVIASLRP